ncbi:MAG: hypothetical protein WCK53_13185 [Methanomicrobiales archaeon]
MTTGIIYTPKFLAYTNSPENKDRVSATVDYFKTQGPNDFISPMKYDEDYTLSVHTPEYIEFLKSVGVIEGNKLTYANVLLSAYGLPDRRGNAGRRLNKERLRPYPATRTPCLCQ